MNRKKGTGENCEKGEGNAGDVRNFKVMDGHTSLDDCLSKQKYFDRLVGFVHVWYHNTNND